ncbi:MAG: CbtA family protein [Propioniciclava sp.]|uniref:CbtA family protein n=1 Tax=Propioniciclava sp. TaxID=2038686 RepID=UPI0039E674CA
MLTLRDFLVRGLLAGLIAGIAAFVVGYAVGEPPVAASIAIEEAAGGHDHGTAAEEPAAAEEEDEGTEVPRPVQSTVGLATGFLVLGAALGGATGLLTGAAMGRFFSRTSVRVTALGVTAVAFVSVFFVPYLIYPPNPPAVGDGETIGYRTSLYFAMVALSIAAAVLGLLVNRNLRAKLGSWYAALAGVATYVVLAVVALGVMPRYDEVPTEGFPPSLLWEFRLSSLLTQIVLWGVLGIVLAELSHRALAQKTAPGSRRLINA